MPEYGKVMTASECSIWDNKEFFDEKHKRILEPAMKRIIVVLEQAFADDFVCHHAGISVEKT